MSTATVRPVSGAVRASRPLGVTGLWSVASVRWATVALGLFLSGFAAQLLDAPSGLWWALYLACYVTGGWSRAWKGMQALRSRTLDVDLLILVAAVGAAGIGQIVDGALLIVIFATSGALEDAAIRRTADSVKGLLDLAPDRATRIGADGTEQSVNAEDLRVSKSIDDDVFASSLSSQRHRLPRPKRNCSSRRSSNVIPWASWWRPSDCSVSR